MVQVIRASLIMPMSNPDDYPWKLIWASLFSVNEGNVRIKVIVIARLSRLDQALSLGKTALQNVRLPGTFQQSIGLVEGLPEWCIPGSQIHLLPFIARGARLRFSAFLVLGEHIPGYVSRSDTALITPFRLLGWNSEFRHRFNVDTLAELSLLGLLFPSTALAASPVPNKQAIHHVAVSRRFGICCRPRNTE
nr:hypothetical protein CFP56_10076 [Quercus suber]